MTDTAHSGGSEPSAPSTNSPVAEGEILAGKYRVERVLGIGGMGVVVAAEHIQLRQRVALKFLHAGLWLEPEIVERFMREARAVVQIHTEHVARVIDVGQLPTGSPYIVMEFLEGTDLSEVLKARGPLPIQDAVDYMLQALEAIAMAHRLRIVHRDLKPANLFLANRHDDTQIIKVLDFGISKALEGMPGGGPGAAPDNWKTATFGVLGSPLYMSPEQIRNPRSVDTRTDIWSMGIVLHELLTVQSAFVAETFPGLCAAITSDDPVPLRKHRPDAPAGLEDVILRCLDKEVDRRFQHIGELAEALAPFASVAAKVSVDRIARVMRTPSVIPGPNSRGSNPPPANVTLRPPLMASTPTPTSLPTPSPSPASPASSLSPSSSTLSSSASQRQSQKQSQSGAQGPIPTQNGNAAWGITKDPTPKNVKVVAAMASAGFLMVIGGIAMGGYLIFGRGTPTPTSGSAQPSASAPMSASASAASSSDTEAAAAAAAAASASAAAASAASSSDTPAASASATPDPTTAPTVATTAATPTATGSAAGAKTARPSSSKGAPRQDGFSDRK